LDALATRRDLNTQGRSCREFGGIPGVPDLALSAFKKKVDIDVTRRLKEPAAAVRTAHRLDIVEEDAQARER
jgi:hypothetical protein